MFLLLWIKKLFLFFFFSSSSPAPSFFFFPDTTGFEEIAPNSRKEDRRFGEHNFFFFPLFSLPPPPCPTPNIPQCYSGLQTFTNLGGFQNTREISLLLFFFPPLRVSSVFFPLRGTPIHFPRQWRQSYQFQKNASFPPPFFFFFFPPFPLFFCPLVDSNGQSDDVMILLKSKHFFFFFSSFFFLSPSFFSLVPPTKLLGNLLKGEIDPKVIASVRGSSPFFLSSCPAPPYANYHNNNSLEGICTPEVIMDPFFFFFFLFFFFLPPSFPPLFLLRPSLFCVNLASKKRENTGFPFFFFLFFPLPSPAPSFARLGLSGRWRSMR